MKFALSNIAWDKEQDENIYTILNRMGITGLEIAPTRLFENPYGKLAEARRYKERLYNEYGITVCSMQSIWYGRSENIFIDEQRREIYDYSCDAIDFASAMGIGNIVFGCPKNRNIPSDVSPTAATAIAEEFFYNIGEYAHSNNTVFALEPNPQIYGTNFLNSTVQVLDLVKKIKNKGLKVNIDIGTMIQNAESPSLLADNIEYVNHIHLSVPYLEQPQPNPIHAELLAVLKSTKYNRYLSVEMKNLGDINKVISTAKYLVEFFGNE